MQEVLGEGGQAVVRRATMPNGNSFAAKWYRPLGATRDQMDRLKKLRSAPIPHRAFTWPLDVITASDISGFGYMMRLKQTGFATMSELFRRRGDRPRAADLARTGIDLVDAIDALHGSGWCYRDINNGNIEVDLTAGQVCILDCDNIGTDEDHSAIAGTPRWMAPEIARGEARPTRNTDLYSLAVFLFHLVMQGAHPLNGRRVASAQRWDEEHISATTLTAMHYAKAPLFVFDPEDDSNQPVESGAWESWGRCPSYLRNLFTRSFTSGLWSVDGSERVLERRWRSALMLMRDSVMACGHCDAEIVYEATAAFNCWRCSKVPAAPAVLHFDASARPAGDLVLAAGARLTCHHVLRDNDHTGIAGIVSAHPNSPGELILANSSENRWMVCPDGEGVKVVNPGQKVRLRPMSIDFGLTSGRISLG